MNIVYMRKLKENHNSAFQLSNGILIWNLMTSTHAGNMLI